MRSCNHPNNIFGVPDAGKHSRFRRKSLLQKPIRLLKLRFSCKIFGKNICVNEKKKQSIWLLQLGHFELNIVSRVGE